MKLDLKKTTVFVALVAFAGITGPAQAAPSFDYSSLVGSYVSTGCLSGYTGEMKGHPIPAWDGTEVSISKENSGLVVTTPKANLPKYFASAFAQIDHGPQPVHQSNPDFRMFATGNSTAVTTPNGVRVTVQTDISTPIGENGFFSIAELSVTSDGILYTLSQISPDPARGSTAQWVDWHSCVLKKVDSK